MKKNLPAVSIFVSVAIIYFAYHQLKPKPVPEPISPFVQVEGARFLKNKKAFTFLGANYWQGANLGMESPSGNRERLIRELDQMAALGINSLRILAASEGPSKEPYRIHPAMQEDAGVWSEEALEGLDFLLSEMGKRKMHAIMVLNNFWPWSGGMAQYLKWSGAGEIPYPPPHPKGDWDRYQKFTAQFYSNRKAVEMSHAHIDKIISRKNSTNQVFYKDDPTILAWELCNEPRGMDNIENYNAWIEITSNFIRNLDTNHLITIGSEGDTSDASYAGIDFIRNHSFKNIDFTTAHVWIENWGWYDPTKTNALAPALEKARSYIKTHVAYAKVLNKPLLLEEFGIARDKGSFEVNSTTQMRDIYYENIFKLVLENIQNHTPLQAVMFWAWAGEGRPTRVKGIWKTGDDWIGDPPHEFQGWYSVYNSDKNTADKILNWSEKINSN